MEGEIRIGCVNGRRLLMTLWNLLPNEVLSLWKDLATQKQEHRDDISKLIGKYLFEKQGYEVEIGGNRGPDLYIIKGDSKIKVEIKTPTFNKGFITYNFKTSKSNETNWKGKYKDSQLLTIMRNRPLYAIFLAQNLDCFSSSVRYEIMTRMPVSEEEVEQ